MDLISIGELARRTDVSSRSLRYYEEQGLLVPDRSSAGHRLYDPEAAGCVAFIQRMFSSGLTSDEVRVLAAEWRHPDGERRIRALLEARQAELDAKMVQLAQTRHNLEQLVSELAVHTGVKA